MSEAGAFTPQQIEVLKNAVQWAQGPEVVVGDLPEAEAETLWNEAFTNMGDAFWRAWDALDEEEFRHFIQNLKTPGPDFTPDQHTVLNRAVEWARGPDAQTEELAARYEELDQAFWQAMLPLSPEEYASLMGKLGIAWTPGPHFWTDAAKQEAAT
jgi:hypothetical protein